MTRRGQPERVGGPTRTAADPDAVLSQSEPDAREYWHGSRSGFSTERLERRLILELAGNVSGRAVLDVGCGDGNLALVLARLGADVTGIDSCPAMIEGAGRRTRHHGVDIVFERADAEWLPFHPEEFDVVTAVAVLGCIENAHCVLEEIARVLKPGGRLVIGEFGTWRPQAMGRRMHGWRGLPFWRHARLSTARELRELAEGAGFGIETVRGALYHACGTAAAGRPGASDSHVGRFMTADTAFVALSASRPEKFSG